MRVVGEIEKGIGSMHAPEQGPWEPAVPPAIEPLLAEHYPEGNGFEDFEEELPPDAFPPVQLSEEVVSKVLRACKPDRSEGVSGCCNALLKTLATKGSPEQTSRFCSKVCALFNVLASGEALPLVHPFWSAARLAVIPKDPVGVRILGIGEVLYRALGASANATLGREVGQAMEPEQLAVAVSGGVEIAAAVVDTKADDPHMSTLVIDCKNAYGTIDRGAIYKGCKQRANSLVRLFRWTYGRRNELRDHLGKLKGHATRGVFIGDALGTLYYSLGKQEAAEKLTQCLRDSEDALGVPLVQRGLVILIADDITIKGRTDVLFSLYPHIEDILSPYGLQLNASKIFFVGRNVQSAPGPPEDITLCNGGRPPAWYTRLAGSLHQRQDRARVSTDSSPQVYQAPACLQADQVLQCSCAGLPLESHTGSAHPRNLRNLRRCYCG